MNRITRSVLPAIAMLALGAGAARAQTTVPSSYQYVTTKNAFEVTGGYMFADPSLSLDTTATAEFAPRSAPTVAVRYLRRLGGPISLAVGLGYTGSERKVIAAGRNQDSTFSRPLETGDRVPSNIVELDAGFRLHLTGDRTFRGLAPFLGVQAGVVTELGGTRDEEKAIPATERFDFGPAFAVGTGLGLDYFVTRRASLHTQADFRLWRMSVPNGFGVAESSRGRWKGNTGVSVGAAFHF